VAAQDIVEGIRRAGSKVSPCSVHGHVIDPRIFQLLDAPFCRQSLSVAAQAFRVTGHRGMHVQQGAISVEDDRIEVLPVMVPQWFLSVHGQQTANLDP
jgi:hypothetical protein